MALAIPAKRKGGQAIENKQLREMVHFATTMISMAYDQRHETARFARRKNPFGFAGFSAPSRPKTQGSEINGGFGARAADVARLGDSGIAPQAVGIAQNGLGNGGAGCNRGAGESFRRTPYQRRIPVHVHSVPGESPGFGGISVHASNRMDNLLKHHSHESSRAGSRRRRATVRTEAGAAPSARRLRALPRSRRATAREAGAVWRSARRAARWPPAATAVTASYPRASRPPAPRSRSTRRRAT